MLTAGLVLLLILAATWVGYPLAMWTWARQAARRQWDPPDREPDLAVVIATREEPRAVAARVANVMEAEGLQRRPRVVVAVDHTAARAVADYTAALGPGVLVVAGDPPGGKATTLNAGVRAAADSEVIVFADTGQRFSAGAIAGLVATLARPGRGAVSGVVEHRSGDRLLDRFGRLEALIRSGQAASHSLISTSGAIYALRRALWRPLPDGLIGDDLFTTLGVVFQGYRVDFCPGAVAVDERRFSPEQHVARRVRTLTGLIQYMRLEPRVLLPWSNPVWVHFLFQKLLRLATPLLAVAAAGCLGLALVAAHPALAIRLAAAIGGLALLLAVIRPRLAARLGRNLLWALRLLGIPLLALRNGLTGQWTVWPGSSADRRAGVR